MKKVIGAILLASFYMALFGISCAMVGVKEAMIVWGLLAMMIAVLATAVWLICS